MQCYEQAYYENSLLWHFVIGFRREVDVTNFSGHIQSSNEIIHIADNITHMEENLKSNQHLFRIESGIHRLSMSIHLLVANRT